MTSAIDPSVVGTGNVDKAAFRLQLERARDEISALQTGVTALETEQSEVLLTRTVITSLSSAVDFALPTGYSSYRMVGITLFSASANLQLAFRVSTNSGVSYDAGASDYGYAYSFQSNALNASAASGSFILLTEQAPANTPQFFTAFISPGDAAFGLRTWGTNNGVNTAGTHFTAGTFTGARSATGRATNIRLLPSVQLGVGGLITLFGIV